MKKTIFIFLYFFLICKFSSGLNASSWKDLDEGEHSIYGSEREEKYPVRVLFIEKEEWKDHYSLMFLWLYKYTDYPKYTSRRVLPFYYNLSSKTDNRSETYIFPLISYFRTEGEDKTSYILYPFYYSHTNPKETDRSVLFLLRWGYTGKGTHYTDSYSTFIPFFYFSDSENTVIQKNENLFISPVFSIWNKNIKNENTERIWWAPVIPLTYHSTDRYGGHRNILWLMDYSWTSKNGNDRMERFWFFPFFMWGRGDDGYLSFMPPVFIYSRSGTAGNYYSHFLPFYINWHNNNGTYTREQTISLLYGSRKVTDSNTKEEIYSNFWFPLIPLYYKSKDNNGTHTNVLGIFDWNRKSNGDLLDFSIIPFVSYENKDNGWGRRLYFPFYYRPGEADEKSGYSLGLLHYHKWSGNAATWWIWPYYHSEEYDSGNFSTFFMPVYYSWKDENSKGKVILPLVFNYSDAKRSLHINLSGISYQTLMGPLNPDFSFGFAKKDETWYLDTDISWLYDMFSYSRRDPIKNPFADSESINEKKDNIRTASIQKKKDTDRENSEYFRGWKILFGWMAYEKSDSIRHFRLLPLSWLTWDSAGRDTLYVFLPFYLQYYSSEKDESYLLLAPFYGKQKQGRSYAYGVLINGFWSEYNDAEEYYEKTVLWPFINWYESPSKNGFRIFPFFWHKETISEKEHSYKNISLLYYSNLVQSNEGFVKYSFKINPLFYYKNKMEDNTRSLTLFAPIIPLFYYRSQKSTGTADEFYHWNFFGILDRYKGNDYSRFFMLPFYYTSSDTNSKHYNILGIIDWSVKNSGSLNYSMCLPLFYYKPGAEGRNTIAVFPLLTYIDKAHSGSTYFIAGLYLYNSAEYNRQNLLYIYDHKRYSGKINRNDTYSFLFGTSSVSFSNNSTRSDILWGTVFDYTNYRNSENYNISGMLWLMAVNREGADFHSRILPVYSYWSDDDSWSLLLPPALSYFSESKTEDFDLGLLGLLYYRNRKDSIGTDRRNVLLGALYNEYKQPERGYHEWGSLWGTIWSYEVEEETGYKRFSILKGLFGWSEKDGATKYKIFWI